MKKKITKIIIFTIFIMLFYIVKGDVSFGFEKGIEGSTGWAAINLSARSNADTKSNVTVTIPAGGKFLILNEKGEYWKVNYNGTEGFVQSNYCMINLPDVTPSIEYNITNATGSIYKSSGYDIPDVTGKKLYNTGKVMNNKLGKEEFACPVLYTTAQMIDKAQTEALKDGYCLKIYDSYRPRSVTRYVSGQFSKLYNSNSEVRLNVDRSIGASGAVYYWGQTWFLATGLSAHNTGAAIDVTLCKNDTKQECKMSTVMHELSSKAIKYYCGSCAKVPANYSKEMTDGAKLLDRYMTNAGMATLASEWWHFQDNNGYNRIKNATNGNGCDFQVDGIVSVSDKKDPVEENPPSEKEEETPKVPEDPPVEKEDPSAEKEEDKEPVVKVEPPKVINICLTAINRDYVHITVIFDKNVSFTKVPELYVTDNGKEVKLQYCGRNSDSIVYRAMRDRKQEVHRIELKGLKGGDVVSKDNPENAAMLGYKYSKIAIFPGKDSYFDIDKNGVVDKTDADKILQAYAKEACGGEKANKAFDIDGDGKVDATDASAVLTYSTVKHID